MLAYFLVMGRYIYYWRELSTWETPQNFVSQTCITVLIPARNEVENISDCVQSILQQDYPSNLLELIVIDDHSTDDTYTILNEIKDDRLKILQLVDFPDDSPNQAFKKRALQIGIDQSSGQLILTTDADCIVPDRWLQRMAHLYESKGAKFIAAPVNFYQERTILEKFQSLDFSGMMGITGAGINGRFMHMCNGANLGYDRTAFYEVEGFSGIDHLASGDDMLLMQKIARRYPQSIHYLKHPAATVFTKAQPTVQRFFNQRIRWASKSSDYKERQVTAMLGIVWIYCWSILLALFSSIMLGYFALGLTLFLVFGKAFVDFILLRMMTRFFNRMDLMTYFWPSQVLHILYIVVVGTLSLVVKKYVWKGRMVR